MKIRNMILSFFGKTCVGCVGLAIIFYTFTEITYASSVDAVPGIGFSRFMLLLLTSALFAASSYLFLIPIPKILNFLLNYIFCFSSFFLIFHFAGSFNGFLAPWIIFTLFYAVFWGAYLLLRFLLYPEKRKRAAEKKKEEEYVNRF